MNPIYGIHRDNPVLRLLVYIKRRELKRKFRSKMQTLESTLQIIIEALDLADKRGHTHHRHLWNTAGYINVCSYDLVTILGPSVFNRNKWYSRHQARQAAVLMYEACRDLPELLGKDFRKSLTALGAPKEMFIALNKARKPLDAFAKKHSKKFRKIRINACAHRDKELSNLINIVKELDPMEMESFGMEFDKILNELGMYVQNMLTWASQITT